MHLFLLEITKFERALWHHVLRFFSSLFSVNKNSESEYINNQSSKHQEQVRPLQFGLNVKEPNISVFIRELVIQNFDMNLPKTNEGNPLNFIILEFQPKQYVGLSSNLNGN